MTSTSNEPAWGRGPRKRCASTAPTGALSLLLLAWGAIQPIPPLFAQEPAPDSPAAPELPHPLPEPHIPSHRGSLVLSPRWTEMQLGVGHLVAIERRPFWAAEWVSRVVVPLFSSPAGELAGWLARGWLLRTAEALAFDTSAMIEIDYESLSFVVLEMRSDGWFLFQLGTVTPASEGRTDGDPATFWAHVSHLSLGEIPLTVERWEELFARPETPPLFFRNRTSRHALRAVPSVEGDILLRIGADHSMELLDVAGNWMHVRVSQPSAACPDPRISHRAVDEGWIRWRSPEKGPWVWYSARGC